MEFSLLLERAGKKQVGNRARVLMLLTITDSVKWPFLLRISCNPPSLKCSFSDNYTAFIMRGVLKEWIWTNIDNRVTTLVLTALCRPRKPQHVNTVFGKQEGPDSPTAWITAWPPPREQRRRWREHWRNEPTRSGESPHIHPPGMDLVELDPKYKKSPYWEARQGRPPSPCQGGGRSWRGRRSPARGRSLLPAPPPQSANHSWLWVVQKNKRTMRRNCKN